MVLSILYVFALLPLLTTRPLSPSYGTFLFNTLVQPPRFLRPRVHTAPATADETRALLAREALDETAALPADLGQSGYDVVPPHHNHPHGPSGGAQAPGQA